MKKRLPFTALELVLVCAVAAILLSISLPAFYNISSGRRLTGAMSAIAANISLARARAVSDHIYTALIFYSGDSTRLAEIRKTSSGFAFVKWLDGSSWERIGDGVVIPDGDKNFHEGASGTTAPYSISSVDFSDLGGGTSAATRAITFSPRGQILISDSSVKPITIRAAEGTKIPGSDTFTLKKTGSKTTYAVLTVNSISGRTAVSYEDE